MFRLIPAIFSRISPKHSCESLPLYLQFIELTALADLLAS